MIIIIDHLANYEVFIFFSGVNIFQSLFGIVERCVNNRDFLNKKKPIFKYGQAMLVTIIFTFLIEFHFLFIKKK